MDVYISSVAHGGEGSGCCRFCDSTYVVPRKAHMRTDYGVLEGKAGAWRFRCTCGHLGPETSTQAQTHALNADHQRTAGKEA